jgi:hypothetical protein
MNTLFDMPATAKTKRTTQRMVGSRNNDVDGDFYPTPEVGTAALLGRELFTGDIWEPACGDGAMSRVIEDYGYRVRSTDLFDRGYGDAGVDFLRCTDRAANIVTNPPFKYANQFIHKALTKADSKVALLLRLNYLESKTRKKFFQNYKPFPFKKVLVFSERLPFNGPGSMMAFAWFIWDRNYTGKPEIDWI